MIEKPLDLEINFTEPRFWITRDEPDFEEIMREVKQRIKSAVQGLLEDIGKEIYYDKHGKKIIEPSDVLKAVKKWFGEVLE